MLRTLLYLAPLLPQALGETSLQTRQDGNEDIPTRLYRRRGMQQVTRLGDFIYFNGGEMSNYDDGELEDGMNPSRTLTTTMTLPHNESWDVATVEFHIIQHDDDDPPSINTFALWHDEQDSRLYRWGGSLSRNSNISEDDVVLWQFAPSDNGEGGDGEWDTSDPANPDTFNQIYGTTGGGSASCDRKGFYIGGVGRGSTDPRLAAVDVADQPPVPGILTYDMETRQWSNDSTAPLSPPYGSILNSNAACAEGFDTSPLIFSLGGVKTSATSTSAGSTEPIGFRNVSFWDPSSSIWRWQMASGEIPPGRMYPCVVGARSRDETYEIFMYGGSSPVGGTRGDMYILSLPGFVWFKVDVESPPRLHHACARVGNRQMLSTGGLTGEWDWESKDPWVHGLGLFDMSALEWKTSFDADADDYDSPSMVKDWYNQGNLNSVEWNDSGVKAMFVDGSGDPGTGSGSGSGDGGNSSSSSNTGAIAGGVVGGVAGLALIGSLAWFLIRRRKRQNEEGSAALVSNAEDDSPHDGTTPSTQLGGFGSDCKKSPAPTDPTPPPPSESHAPIEMATDGHEMAELPPEHERFELPGNERLEMQG